MFPPEIVEKVVHHLSFTDRRRLLCVNSDFAFFIGKWKGVTLRIASFDIGKNNFAQYVEECSLDTLIELSQRYDSLPKSKQRRTKGIVYPEIGAILNELYITGTRVEIGVFDFQVGDTRPGSKNIDHATRLQFLQHLREFEALWKTCDIFIIEQQFINMFPGQKGGTVNVAAIKLEEALTMWLLDRFPEKVVVNFGSKYKTQTLGAPAKLTTLQRKKWAVQKASEIFTLRKDEEAIQIYALPEKIKRKRLNTEAKIQSYLGDFDGCASDIQRLAQCIVRRRQKMDDISDVVVQAQAYKYRTFVATF